MKYQINLQCGSKNKNEEEDYHNIINKHCEYILNLERDLKQYKDFHDAILDNNIISKQFELLNNKIKKLEEENKELRSKNNNDK